MPTGYTAGVVDGTIKTFKDFAKNCMRAFGATIHMRDQPMNKKYEPRVPDSYYLENLEEAKAQLAGLDTLPDEYFVNKVHSEIKSEIKYCLKKIEEKKEIKQRLDSLLSESESWNPPTEEHTEFKKFMINQLQQTLDYDADVSYYEVELEEQYKKLESPIDVEKVKADLRKEYEEAVKTRQKSLDEEIERCNKSNEWVNQLLKSIE